MQRVTGSEKKILFTICILFHIFYYRKLKGSHSGYIILYIHIILTYSMKSCLCSCVILPELLYIFVVYELSNAPELKNAFEGKVELEGPNVEFIELKFHIKRLLLIIP